MSDPYVLPETAAVLAGLAEQPGPHLADLSAADMRATYLQMGALFDVPAEAQVTTKDFEAVGCRMRAYFPGPAAAGPAILYMHGGGWVIGDLDTHNPFCSLLAAATGLRVVAVDYRMAPEHPFPAAHDDCLAAARFVAGSPAVLDAPVTGLAVAGDSAGGNLALYVASRLGSGVVAQLLIYPLVDCTSPERGSYKDFAEGFVLDRKLMDRFITDYLPNAADRAGPEASPVLHPLPADLAPAVIVTAGLDPLRDQGRDLAGRIAALGVETHLIEASGLIHGIATMRGAFPTADRIMRRAIKLFSETFQH
ncbi:alpha/beta hydrolase [Sandarakinorhabdus rubra]|uniref:alpha/beta hydrolase n=1 Tax=Sandarakinorhabdus rubra TaxID=2672568 RepID=UPI0013DB1C65|nr:alpha/beta hydrolase [Sandarakinorhabdus rubra]